MRIFSITVLIFFFSPQLPGSLLFLQKYLDMILAFFQFSESSPVYKFSERPIHILKAFKLQVIAEFSIAS